MIIFPPAEQEKKKIKKLKDRTASKKVRNDNFSTWWFANLLSKRKKSKEKKAQEWKVNTKSTHHWEEEKELCHLSPQGRDTLAALLGMQPQRGPIGLTIYYVYYVIPFHNWWWWKKESENKFGYKSWFLNFLEQSYSYIQFDHRVLEQQ